MTTVGSSKRQTDTDSRPTCRDIQDCRVGDWQHVSFVYEWRGKTGVQKFQPASRELKRRSSFDEQDFLTDVPIWKFQKRIWPGMATSSGTWEVWLRIE